MISNFKKICIQFYLYFIIVNHIFKHFCKTSFRHELHFFIYIIWISIKPDTKQKTPYTIISKEFPQNKGEPYYPIINNKNLSIFAKYQKLIEENKVNNIYFEGRLAQYKYFNTDEVIERALTLYNQLKKKKNKI